MKTDIAVLGGGRLAQAVAEILVASGGSVRIWARRPAARRALAKKLEGVQVADTVEAAAGDVDLLFVAVPASALREVLGTLGEVARPDHLLLHATRGVDAGFVLPHQIVRQETCIRRIGVLGGPLHARDLTSGHPIAAVVASRFDETFAAVRRLTDGGPVHLQQSHDVVGVEVAGAVANVTALAVGMADALDLGDTARGVLLTRGLVEASRIGVHLGGVAETFTGLAGVGDLIPRRVASTERHHALGAALASGQNLDEAISAQKGEVEGVLTAQEAVRLAERAHLDLPLVQAVDMVLHGEADARAALEDVLGLDLDLGKSLAARA